jgi:hypothetical protein
MPHCKYCGAQLKAPFVNLTPMERKIYIILKTTKVPLTHAQLKRRLYGYDVKSGNVVQCWISHLRAKFQGTGYYIPYSLYKLRYNKRLRNTSYPHSSPLI